MIPVVVPVVAARARLEPRVTPLCKCSVQLSRNQIAACGHSVQAQALRQHRQPAARSCSAPSPLSRTARAAPGDVRSAELPGESWGVRGPPLPYVLCLPVSLQ